MQIERVGTPLDIPPLIQECLKNSFLKNVRFSREYPNEPVQGPVIVWRLVRRVMGKEGKERLKPRIRGYQNMGSDRQVTFWGQWTTAIFQFDLFHVSEQEVDELMCKFELFVMEIRRVLCLSGVDQIIFDEQLQDYSLPTPKEIPQRSVRYSAVMTTLYPVYNARVNQIVLSIASATKTDFIAAVRGDSGLTDSVEIDPVRITGIGDNEVDLDYVAGVDYDLSASDDGTTITWLEHGLHPSGGATYYVRYSTLDDPLQFTVPANSP